jgi:hypothetical protein
VFPDVSLAGGTLLGVPTIVALDAPDSLVVAIDAAAVVVADNGIELDPSAAAAVQMDTAPSAGATNVVSLWQSDSIAVRVTRWISWVLGREDGVVVLSLDAGSPGSPA